MMEKKTNWTNSDEATEFHGTNRNFICVEHPAVVENIDKVLETIGGTESVAKTYSEINKRLALYWRPNDAFCKPAFAERLSTTSMLLKVRRRRKKGDHSGESDQYSVECLGDIGFTYRFQGVADFQYLPMVRKDVGQTTTEISTSEPHNKSESTRLSEPQPQPHDKSEICPQYESILDKLKMDGIVDRKEYLSRDVPMYLPPMVFSRIDLPDRAYLYRPAVAHRPGYVNPDSNRPENLIGTVRQKRTVFTVFANYKDSTPTAPTENARQQLDKKYKNEKEDEEIKKLFEMCPIWSRIRLNHHFSGRKDKLKFILPLHAYYFLSGPWRCLWVRFGYDPRKDPTAKIYQTVDFRKRQLSIGDPVGIKIKRAENTMAFPSSTRLQMNTPKIEKVQLDQNKAGKPKADEPADATDTEDSSTYIYTADKIPPCRQMYYQLLDCHTEEIQYLVKKNDGREKICDERDGWCLTGVIDKCRDIITYNTQQLLEKEDSIYKSNAVLRKRKNWKKKRPEYRSDSEEEMDMTSVLEEDMNVMETEILDCP